MHLPEEKFPSFYMLHAFSKFNLNINNAILTSWENAAGLGIQTTGQAGYTPVVVCE